VSVIADTATVADAMSTALSVMPLEHGAALAKALRLDAHIALSDGSRLHWMS
jgi:thiamine biosynthesis lipoprotein ApbE